MYSTFMNDIQDKVNRYKKFYESKDPALLVLINCTYGEKEELPSLSLEGINFNDRNEINKYLEERAKWLAVSSKNRSGIQDDYMPVDMAYYGQALFSTYVFDRPVRFIDKTSWADPCINEWSDLDKLKIDEDNFWFRLNIYSCQYLKDKLEDIGFIRSPNYGPLDLANALRGNDLFIDFHDYPEQVKELIDFCTKAFIWKCDSDRIVISHMEGGQFGHWGVWYPGNSGDMSIDASTMVSPEIFEEYELPAIQKIMDHCGGYTIHTHAAGSHQYENYTRLKGLDLINLSTEPGVKDPVEDLEHVIGKLGTMPVLIAASPEQVKKYIKTFKKGRFIISTYAETELEANELLTLVRSNSRV